MPAPRGERGAGAARRDGRALRREPVHRVQSSDAFAALVTRGRLCGEKLGRVLLAPGPAVRRRRTPRGASPSSEPFPPGDLRARGADSGAACRRHPRGGFQPAEPRVLLRPPTPGFPSGGSSCRGIGCASEGPESARVLLLSRSRDLEGGEACPQELSAGGDRTAAAVGRATFPEGPVRRRAVPMRPAAGGA